MKAQNTELSQHKNISDEMIRESFPAFLEKHPEFKEVGIFENWCAGAMYMREWFLKALLESYQPDPTPSGAEVYRKALEQISISRENANIIAAEALAKVGQSEEVKGEERDELLKLEIIDAFNEYRETYGRESVGGGNSLDRFSIILRNKLKSKYTITRK